MNTHAVSALPPVHPDGTHQSGRLFLEVARRNAAHPVLSAVADGGASSCGVPSPATYSNGSAPVRFCDIRLQRRMPGRKRCNSSRHGGQTVRSSLSGRTARPQLGRGVRVPVLSRN